MTIISAEVAIQIIILFAISTVMADDPDAGSNGEVKYSLAEVDVEGAEGGGAVPFAVDAHSGWVTTTAALDRETRAEYRLALTARDAGAQARVARGSLVVRLVDYDDCPPRFTQEIYSAEVSCATFSKFHSRLSFHFRCTRCR